MREIKNGKETLKKKNFVDFYTKTLDYFEKGKISWNSTKKMSGLLVVVE